MSSTYNDILDEFDLEFFDHTCPKELPGNKWEKQKKAVSLAKKKIIATDSLVKAYYEKKNAHEYTEKCLFESKVECKQVCIDYRNTLEKCAKLEKEENIMRMETKSLNERLLAADDHYAALQSHTNQLQLFVKELKNQIEGYEVEKRLEKENAKENEKRIRHLENDKQQLENDLGLLGDVIAGTKTIDAEIKKLMKKYNKTVKSEPEPSKEAESTDEGLDTPSTWPENVMHDGIDLSDMEDDDADIIHTVIIVEDENDIPNEICDANDSDFCNDITSSVDTGRGSSLALSPEYSINRPCAENKPTIVNDNLPTVKVPTTCHRGVSPINFENNSVFKCTQTSPDVRQSKKLKHIATSPIAGKRHASIATQSDESYGSNNNVSSKKFNVDHDVEVEIIFNAMRLPFEELSPLPPSPAPSPVPIPVPAPHPSEDSSTTQHTSGEQLEAAKIWQQFEMLTTRIANIEKELKESNNTKLNNQLADIMTEARIPARQEVPAIIVSEEGCVTEDEEDIIRIPNNEIESVPSECCESNYKTKSRETSLDIIRRLEFSESVPGNHEENDLGHVESELNDSSDIISPSGKRRKRTAKLTKLQKLKVSLIPKCKIKNTTTPAKKLRSKTKPIKPLENGKVTTQTEISSKALNEKAVYEKALAVVAEIRAKENNKEENKLKKKQVALTSQKTETVGISNPDDHKTTIKQTAVIDNTDHRNIENRSCTKSKTKADIHNDSFLIPSEISPKRRRKTSVLDPNSIISNTRRTTRSKIKGYEQNNNDVCETSAEEKLAKASEDTENISIRSPETRNSLKRPLEDNEDVQIRRKLRSSARNSLDISNDAVTDTSTTEIESGKDVAETGVDTIAENINVKSCEKQVILKDYNDLSLFDDSEDAEDNDKNAKQQREVNHNNLKESILCKMIEKHGLINVRTVPKKIPDKIVDEISKTIADGIEKVVSMKPSEAKEGMDELVNKLNGLPLKHFLSGLLKYMKDPERKTELFNKTTVPPAPPMSKQQQVMLYVITQLKNSWPSINLINEILDIIEYAIFRLNNTPEFSTIESLSHFFAVLCRYSRAKYRLRQFMLDAMYCIAFKAVPLIRQVLNVWPHILPLAYTGWGKQPLVTCLVYLLHFYKCEDKFNRVQDIRNILQRKYLYKITDWNETLIIDMLRTALLKKEIPAEQKMLRMAIILLAKRNGARWCDKNIIKGLLLPIIEDSKTKEGSRCFAATLLGPLLRPFPNDMRLHREIVVNKLFDLLDTELSPRLEEAIYSSLICMSKHDAGRVARALLLWAPRQPLSKEFEAQLKNYVREKPIRGWKFFLSNVFK